MVDSSATTGFPASSASLTSGLINGSIAPDTFAQALTGVKYGYPYQQPYTYNSGQTTFGYSFDPVTGAMYNRIAWANSLPPKEAADLADKQDEREEQNNEDIRSPENDAVGLSGEGGLYRLFGRM